MKVTVVRAFVLDRLQVAGERDCCDGGGLSAIDLCDTRLQRNSSRKWSERSSPIASTIYFYSTQVAIHHIHAPYRRARTCASTYYLNPHIRHNHISRQSQGYIVRVPCVWQMLASHVQRFIRKVRVGASS